MNNPQNKDKPDPADAEDSSMTQEAYQAWIDEDPRHAEGFMEIVRRTLAEKADSFSPEKRAELEALARQLGDELADQVVPLHYNPLADRLRELIEQETFSDDEVDELKAMTAKLDRLLDMSLDLVEPRRTKVITTLTSSRRQVQLILDNLMPAEFEMESDEEDEDEEDER